MYNIKSSFVKFTATFLLLAAVGMAHAQEISSVLVVNTDHPQKTSILASIPLSTKVIEIAPADNAWRKLEGFLSEFPTVKAIHVLLPSTSASLGTGGSALVATDVDHSGDIAGMAAVMEQPSTVDFLVYSCQLADNTKGKALLMAIDAVTGFNVVSAADCTGVLSPDFTFDYSTKNKTTNAGNLLE